jgi:hypothetical protein
VRTLLRLLMGALAAALLHGAASAAPAEGVVVDRFRVCDSAPWSGQAHCAVKPVWNVDPQGRMIWISATVELPRAANQSGIFVSAYASSAAYWDGKLAGTNGRPGNDRLSEQPGLREAAFPIPAAATGAGRHELTLKVSTMWGLLRIRSPIVSVRVGPYERPLDPPLRHYLPALITANGLLLAALGFSAASWASGQMKRGKYLAGAALFITSQLAAEASRAFLPYLYPGQVLRVCLILGCACGFAVMLNLYVVRRFDFRGWKLLLAGQVALGLAAIVVAPAFDQKTALVLASGAALGMVPAAIAARASRPGAVLVSTALGACLLLWLLGPSTFLDRDLYLWAFGLFAVLFAQEMRQLGRPAEGEPIVAAADRAEEQPFESPWLGAGSIRHFVSPADIVRLAAADDYTEIFLGRGSSILHPEPLHRMLQRLPKGFLRIHRGHAINLSHLRSFRKGPRSSVSLSDASTAPVSRRSVAKLEAALQP